ncbi:uncharacterized protein LOC119766945 [Culex quinquefasciatus]|uniref:uncharacterized protein LOC119766945 n=1 Tax=Culex quinquefasciatus TaxID=7176 RepID=UPI0018E35F42|nr:uncharacterized protein LOC119766945 [Culex quinquefasciatus]
MGEAEPGGLDLFLLSVVRENHQATRDCELPHRCLPHQGQSHEYTLFTVNLANRLATWRNKRPETAVVFKHPEMSRRPPLRWTSPCWKYHKIYGSQLHREFCKHLHRSD